MARRLVAVQEVVPDVTTLEDYVLWCRTERHLWHWQRDAIVKDVQAFTRTLACERCGAEKIKTISTHSFRVTSSRIRYPQGYLIKGSGRIDASDVYRVQYQRRRPQR